MKKRWMYFLMVLVVGLSVALTGCNSEQADTAKEKKDEPKVEEPQTKVKAKAIDTAVDKCENCKMAVANNEDATEIVLKDGKTLVFDDIGCMVNKWIRANGTEDIDAAFVRSHDDKEWLDYEKAVYVFDPKITTAMGYGVIAFKEKEGAQNFIDKNGMGTMMTKAELDKHTWPQDKNNMTMKKHMDSTGQGSMNMDSVDQGSMNKESMNKESMNQGQEMHGDQH
jgi:copper chaperone NosL